MPLTGRLPDEHVRLGEPVLGRDVGCLDQGHNEETAGEVAGFHARRQRDRVAVRNQVWPAVVRTQGLR